MNEIQGRRPFPWLVALCGSHAGTALVYSNFAGALPLIQAEWELSNTEAGLIQAAGQIGYLLAVLLFSSLTDYVGARRLIILGTLWAGVSNLALAVLAHDTVSASFLRALVGLGVAAIYMPGVRLIAQLAPTSRRGRDVGLFVAAFTIGSSVSIALGGALSAAVGWRLAFALSSIGPLVGAFFSRHIPAPAAQQTPTGQHAARRPLSDLFRNRAALLIIIVYSAHAWELLGLRGWLSASLTASLTFSGIGLGDATRQGALLAGVATMVGGLAVALVAAFSDRFGRVPTIIGITAASAVTTLIFGLTLNSSWFLVMLVALVMSFLTNADSAVISTSLTETVPADYLGRAMAIYSFMGFTAGSIAPLAFGAVLDRAVVLSAAGPPGEVVAYRWAFATLALGSLVGLVAAIILYRLPSVAFLKRGIGSPEVKV